MKLILLGAAAVVAPLFTPALQSAFQPVPIEAGLPQRSLLGNGGLESWSMGASFQGSIAPDLWYAMGTTSGFFAQSAIAFTRVPEDPACGASAPWCAEVRANLPANYISQRLEDFAGLADRWVTFSVDLRSPFATASPTIEIDDGVSSSSKMQMVGTGSASVRFTRVTVRHQVNACATHLEFRVYPEQTIQMNDAMAVVGRHAEATYVPRRNAEPGLMELPLGSVVDWYRFDASMPVPEGFAICDGTVVSDADSPFVGQPTPSLANKFVRGVTSVGSIGSVGGADAFTGVTGSGHEGVGNPPAGFWRIVQNPPAPWLLAANETHYHPITVPTVPAYVGLLKIIRVK